MTNDPSYQARKAILDASLPLVPFEGWTAKMLKLAVATTALPAGADALYFPGGPLEVIAFWNAECDRKAAVELAKLDLASMRVRDKVTAGVLARFYAIGPHEEAARRAIARTALPDGLTESPKILWAAADSIWRTIGDKSGDFNFYTKRTILAAVISTSFTAWLSDTDPEKEKARTFLDTRIENVMQFETAKFKIKKQLDKMPDPVKILGHLRYGRKHPL